MGCNNHLSIELLGLLHYSPEVLISRFDDIWCIKESNLAEISSAGPTAIAMATDGHSAMQLLPGVQPWGPKTKPQLTS